MDLRNLVLQFLDLLYLSLDLFNLQTMAIMDFILKEMELVFTHHLVMLQVMAVMDAWFAFEIVKVEVP